MGAEPYWYIVKYNPDIKSALHELREREFRAGRYNPVIPFPQFPVDANSPAPGARHASINAALMSSGENGSRSILDLFAVYDQPNFGGVAPLSDENLLKAFGTTKPTREAIEQNQAFFDYADRGKGIYVVLYSDDTPDEILFAGYSFD
jgi:hypothetical protein